MTLKMLIEKKNKIIKELEKINSACEQRAEEGEDCALTEEEARAYEQKNKELKAVSKLIERKQMLRENSITDSNSQEEEEENEGNDSDTEAQERAAFRDYITSSINQRAVASNMTLTSNGAVIPKTIAKKIIDTLENICDVYERSTKYHFKGEVHFPKIDTSTDDVIVAYQDEFTELTSHVNAISSVKLGGFLSGALCLISKSLINNAEIDVVSIVISRMAYAMKKFLEKECLIGTADKMEGLLSTTNVVTTAAETAITGDELIELQDSIIDGLQSGCVWYMHPKTRTALRKLKDGDGRYLITDLQNGGGSVMLGKPIITSDAMPQIGSGNKAIFYGDPSGLYINIREDMSVEVLREKYSTMHALGFDLWAEIDSKIAEPQKLAVLKCKEGSD